MRLVVLTAAAILALSASASFAQDASVPPALPGNTTYQAGEPTGVVNAPNGDDTIVCNYQRETGTLFVSKVCRTLRAWKMMQTDAHEYMGYGFRGTHQVDEQS